MALWTPLINLALMRYICVHNWHYILGSWNTNSLTSICTLLMGSCPQRWAALHKVLIFVFYTDLAQINSVETKEKWERWCERGQVAISVQDLQCGDQRDKRALMWESTGSYIRPGFTVCMETKEKRERICSYIVPGMPRESHGRFLACLDNKSIWFKY